MKRLYILLAGIAAAAVMAAPASAASSTVTGTITAGTLSIAPAASAAFSLTLDGSNQTTTYNVPSTVTDATGSDSGWNLTITSTPFTTGTYTLPANASTVTSVGNTCLSTCTPASNSIGYPLTVPAAATPPAAVKFFNAAANTGAGKWTTTPSITVAVPGNTHAGTYTSTLTLSAVSGP
jgi:putative surface cell wall-binding protein